MHRNGGVSWFAERTINGVGDDGGSEVITLWIERKPGALWAVGRAVGLAERADGAVHPDDYVFEGYEMEDAVEAANEALESDLEVCRSEGRESGRARSSPPPNSCPSWSAGSSDDRHIRSEA